jgi:predicted transcriptional regulator
MDVLFSRGRATAADVQQDLPDPPSYSSVRALLRILEEKGHIRHEEDGPRYVFMPRLDRDKARQSAVTHLLHTFFDGSAEQAMAALLDASARSLTDDELARMARLIEQARKEDA